MLVESLPDNPEFPLFLLDVLFINVFAPLDDVAVIFLFDGVAEFDGKTT